MTRDEGGGIRGILPFTISEVQALETTGDADVEVAAPQPQQQGEQPSLLDVAVTRMIGKGPEGTRSGCRRSTCPTPSTS